MGTTITLGSQRARKRKTDAALHDEAAGGYDPIHPGAFRPSANQIKYLCALREAVIAGGNCSDAAMQRETRISRMTMWEWKKDPAFVAWLRGAMQTKHDHDFELAMARQIRLAIIGSTRAFEAVARVRSIGQRWGGSWPQEPKIEDRNYVINFLPPPTLPSAQGDS